MIDQRVKAFLLLAFIALFSACTSPATDTRSADEATIRELDLKWSAAAESRNLDAVLSYYSVDAELLPPNAPLAIGATAIRKNWASLLVPEMKVSWKTTKIEVARSGDFAYVIGTYVIAMKDAQGKPADDIGKLLEVWKKQPDGNWKCIADAFNSDLPAPPR